MRKLILIQFPDLQSSEGQLNMHKKIFVKDPFVYINEKFCYCLNSTKQLYIVIIDLIKLIQPPPDRLSLNGPE